MANHDRFEYDVALSFAKQDQAIATRLADLLRARNFRVLLDEYNPAGPGNHELSTRIAELYRTKASYCVMLISQHYPLKAWTQTERTAAQEHALRDADEYIIPLQVDETQVPGVTEANSYRALGQGSLEDTVSFLEEKLTTSKVQTTPPRQSHDLRSGNVTTATTPFRGMSPSAEPTEHGDTVRPRLLARLREERQTWESLLKEIGLEHMEQKGVTGDWSMKGTIAHLTTWWRREVAILAAAQRGETPPEHPPQSEVAVINDWIYLTQRDRPLAEVLRDAGEAWDQFETLLSALPETAFTDPQAFPWMHGRALGESKFHDFIAHLHDEHEPLIRRWLEQATH